MNKPKLAISFSGGRTSAVMTKLCVDKFSDTHDIAITFANTGCEHENTLKFVEQCDKHFGWGVVWVEALINQKQGEGTRHTVVNYETASRKGEPFIEAAKKYGLPNPIFQWCTRELKEHAMRSYLRYTLEWKPKTYWTAIGIRSDEMDRVSQKRLEHMFVYPLVDAGWTKEDIKAECASWPFDLDLKGEHYGNCVWCYKKSMRKLLTLAQDDETIFDFPKYLEDKFSECGAGATEQPRQIFRKKMTTVDIISMAREGNFEPYVDTDQLDFGFSQPSYDVFLDTGSACGESCEIGADD
jgi:3'-phosphoadenosine 5'-phosphosulfate sulfotransferase (PAPS reductase)/FAD synthetase